MAQVTKLTIRFDTKKLHSDLKRLARQSGRSLNAEILFAMRDWVERCDREGK